MRRPEGATAAEYAAWKRTMAADVYQHRVIFRVLDLDERIVGKFEPPFLNGQIQWDTQADIYRTFTGEFLDPGRGVWFEPDSPSDGPIYRKRILQVVVEIFVPGIRGGGAWLASKEFTGPIVKYDRSGPVISISADGKDRLASGTAGRGRVFKRRAQKGAVIRTVLVDVGETRFSIPSMKKARLPKKLVVARTDRPLTVARHVAKSMSRMLFWDGAGRCTLRKRSGRSVFTCGAAMVLSEVSTTAGDMSSQANRWQVFGRKPADAQKRVKSKVVGLPPYHPLSARELRREGKPFPVLVVETNDQMTAAECGARARQLAKAGAVVSDEAIVDVKPIYGLDEADVITVFPPEGGSVKVRAEKATLPLSTDGNPVMTIGQVRKATPSRKRR